MKIDDAELTAEESAKQAGMSLEAYLAADELISGVARLSASSESGDLYALIEKSGGLKHVIEQAVVIAVARSLAAHIPAQRLNALLDDKHALALVERRVKDHCAHFDSLKARPPLPENVIALGQHRVV